MMLYPFRVRAVKSALVAARPHPLLRYVLIPVLIGRDAALGRHLQQSMIYAVGALLRFNKGRWVRPLKSA